MAERYLIDTSAVTKYLNGSLTHKLVLIADNDKDFQKVDSLKTLNPNKLK